MGTGYTRNDVSNNIADENVIDAADLDGEFDAIESAFAVSGHTHDGSAAEGGPVEVIGPVQDFIASATDLRPKTDSVYDLGTDSIRYANGYFDNVDTTALVSTTAAIPVFTGDVVFDTDTLVIDSTNNRVGILETSPDYPLHINCVAYANDQEGGLALSSAGKEWFAEFLLFSDGSGTPGARITAPSDGLGNTEKVVDYQINRTLFYTDDVERMRLTTTGLGIGTTSPDHSLHVSGTLKIDGDSARLFLTETDGGTGFSTTSLEQTNDALRFQTRTSTGTFVTTDYASDKGGSGAITHRFYISGTEQYRFDAMGLGIFTNNPTHALDINSDSFRLRTANVPASASATGTQGQWTWGDDYIYVCVATNTWKRAALSTW